MDETRKTEIGKMLEALSKMKKSPLPASSKQDNGTNIITPPGTDQNETTATPPSSIRTTDNGNATRGKEMAEAFKALGGLINMKKTPGQVSLQQDKGSNIIARPGIVQNVTVGVHSSEIRTADVVASLIKQKRNKKIKQNSIETYEDKLNPFAKEFPTLPETLDPIIDYLSRFEGETGRHRRNNQDAIKMLYTHAVRFFGLSQNPMEKLERTLITHKPIKTLSWKQGQLLIKVPETLQEKTALELLYGHGWRQIEVRRIVARDVAEISDDTILCHGKEREELAPLLPQTQLLLIKMAKGLKPDDHLFISQDGKRRPLGEDGMAQLVSRLFKRAGIKGFFGHDLRRSFATQVTLASKDELLAMRLIRDTVPGVGRRYINFPMEQLVEALKK